MNKESLNPRWHALWARINPAAIRAWVNRQYYEACGPYFESHRRYHDFDHIRYCLRELDRHASLAEDKDSVEFAFWMHDVIYHTRPRPSGLPSNEALSAALADEMLASGNASMEFRQKVVGLIMVTHHHSESAKTRDEMLMADIDWSPLGWPWEQFLENRKKIRIEYRQYSDEQFLAGRKVFLESILRRPSQFYLPEFKEEFEAKARSNVTRELETYSN